MNLLKNAKAEPGKITTFTYDAQGRLLERAEETLSMFNKSKKILMALLFVCSANSYADHDGWGGSSHYVGGFYTQEEMKNHIFNFLLQSGGCSAPNYVERSDQIIATGSHSATRVADIWETFV